MAMSRKERSAKSRAKDPEAANEYLRNWRKNNPKKVKSYIKKNRENKMNVKEEILALLNSSKNGFSEDEILNSIQQKQDTIKAALFFLENTQYLIEKEGAVYVISKKGVDHFKGIARINQDTMKKPVNEDSTPSSHVDNDEAVIIERVLLEPVNDGALTTDLDQVFDRLKSKLNREPIDNFDLKIEVLSRLMPLMDDSISVVLGDILSDLQAANYE